VTAAAGWEKRRRDVVRPPPSGCHAISAMGKVASGCARAAVGRAREVASGGGALADAGEGDDGSQMPVCGAG